MDNLETIKEQLYRFNHDMTSLDDVTRDDVIEKAAHDLNKIVVGTLGSKTVEVDMMLAELQVQVNIILTINQDALVYAKLTQLQKELHEMRWKNLETCSYL